VHYIYANMETIVLLHTEKFNSIMMIVNRVTSVVILCMDSSHFLRTIHSRNHVTIKQIRLATPQKLMVLKFKVKKNRSRCFVAHILTRGLSHIACLAQLDFSCLSLVFIYTHRMMRLAMDLDIILGLRMLPWRS